MIIQDVKRTRDEENMQTLSALVTFETPRPKSFNVYYQFRNAPGEISELADPFVIGFLSPGMLLDEDLIIHGRVDPELLAVIEAKIKPLMRRWLPAFHSPRIQADEIEPPTVQNADRIRASAFSGGVDALYSAARHHEAIDLLVTSEGFDIRTFQPQYWSKIFPQIKDAASTLDRPMMSVRTNIREISHYEAIRTRGGNIDPDYYNLGLNGPIGHYFASIARCMVPFCSDFTIGSSSSYDELFMYGSHPLLDPMWSTSQLEIHHSGCEANRGEKIAYLKTNFPQALRRLRVCWKPLSNAVNCGKCEKCLRTIAECMLCGAEDLVETFDWPPDFLKLRGIRPDRLRIHYWEDIRREALRQGNRELIEASELLLGRHQVLLQALKDWSHRRTNRRRAREMWRYTSHVMSPPSKDLYRVDTPD